MHGQLNPGSGVTLRKLSSSIEIFNNSAHSHLNEVGQIASIFPSFNNILYYITGESFDAVTKNE